MLPRAVSTRTWVLRPSRRQLLQQGQAVDLGQHEVEDDHVVVRGPGLEIAFFAVGGTVHGEALFLEPLPEGPGQGRVVFNQEHAHRLPPFRSSVQAFADDDRRRLPPPVRDMSRRLNLPTTYRARH